MEVNKVNYGEKTLIDLTQDTVMPETLLKGVKAHNSKGEIITGTYEDSGWTNIDFSDWALNSNYYIDLGRPLSEINGFMIQFVETGTNTMFFFWYKESNTNSDIWRSLNETGNQVYSKAATVKTTTATAYWKYYNDGTIDGISDEGVVCVRTPNSAGFNRTTGIRFKVW